MPNNLSHSPSVGKTTAVPADLQNFDSLPRAALVDVHVTSGIFGIAPGTTWRHVKANLIPAPIRVGGRMTRWNVGELRDHIEAARANPRVTWRCPPKKEA